MGKALIIIVVVVLSVYSLFDVLAADRSRVRVLPRPVWVLVVLVPVLGPLLWLTLGRPPTATPRGRSGPPTRVVGPDDDPDFLWNLERRRRSGRKDEDPPPEPST